jgi:hypothetical protein
VFGEMSLLTGEPRTASVITVSECEVHTCLFFADGCHYYAADAAARLLLLPIVPLQLLAWRHIFVFIPSRPFPSIVTAHMSFCSPLSASISNLRPPLGAWAHFVRFDTTM